MNSNKAIIIITILTILIVITFSSFQKINNAHKENLYKSAILKITEAAKKCINDNKCTSEKIFIKELYAKKYLNKNDLNIQEYITENSYVIKKEGKYQFITE